MGALSGKYGECVAASSNINEFRDWELDYGAKTEVYASRHGGGAEETVDGVFGGTGTIMMNLDPSAPITAVMSSGDLVSLNLYARKNAPVQAYGQARLGKFKYGAKRSGEVQTITIPFTCHGFWVYP